MYLLWLNHTHNIRRALSSRSGFLVREMFGFSLPDKDHIFARAPQQHGATYIDTFFRPRECSLVIYVRGCDADEFQSKHRELVRAMNPLDDCELRIEADNHVRYTLTCRPVTLMEVNRHSALAADIFVQLIADDPFFHTAEAEEAFASGITSGLLIPFVLPAIITGPTNAAVFTVNNTGDIFTWPIIDITGPCTNPEIFNDTTGRTLVVNVGVNPGDVLTVNMGERTAIITGAGGIETNVLGDVDGLWWPLEIGNNAIRITSTIAALFSGVLTHTDRYLAIV